MRIIKSDKEKILKCPNCKCLFAYISEEIEDLFNVKCPCCNVSKRFWEYVNMEEEDDK